MGGMYGPPTSWRFWISIVIFCIFIIVVAGIVNAAVQLPASFEFRTNDDVPIEIFIDVRGDLSVKYNRKSLGTRHGVCEPQKDG
jgi:hypothetical protein